MTGPPRVAAPMGCGSACEALLGIQREQGQPAPESAVIPFFDRPYHTVDQAVPQGTRRRHHRPRCRTAATHGGLDRAVGRLHGRLVQPRSPGGLADGLPGLGRRRMTTLPAGWPCPVTNPKQKTVHDHDANYREQDHGLCDGASPPALGGRAISADPAAAVGAPPARPRPPPTGHRRRPGGRRTAPPGRVSRASRTFSGSNFLAAFSNRKGASLPRPAANAICGWLMVVLLWAVGVVGGLLMYSPRSG